MEVEYPAVRALYALVGAEDRVRAVRFDAEHNYNRDSREAMYGWMARWLKNEPSDAPQKEQAFTPDRLPELLVFHARPLPDGALTPEGLTASWIASARRQLGETPSEVRAAALRHALAFAAETKTPVPPSRASRRRPVVLTAGIAPDVERALQRADYTLRAVAFTPFDEAAAAKVNHFETYNRTPASQRVADVVAALRANPGAVLVASGDAALAGALASAIEPPRLAVLDAEGFDTSRDEDFLGRLYIPGLRRAGDLRTASEMTPGRLVIHNAGADFDAPGARVQQAPLTAQEIVKAVRQAERQR